MTGTGQLPHSDLTIGQSRPERHLAGQYNVARLLAGTGSLTEAAPALVEAVCRSVGFQLGVLWAIEPPRDDLRRVGVWQDHGLPPEERDKADAAGEPTSPSAESLVGVAWETGAAAWSSDLRADPTASSSLAARAGLRAAIAVPISIESRMLGVMEFAAAEIRPANEDVLDLLTAVGRQIGQFMERQRAQDELRRSEQRMVDILQIMPAPFYSIDTEFRLTFVNDMAERLMRMPREELLGKSVWDVFPEAVGTPFELAGRKAMAERVPVDFEEYYPPYDSWFEVHAYPVEGGLTMYFRDVTDRKRAEHALRDSDARTGAIVRSALDSVVSMDHEGLIREFNPAAEATFGYRRDEVIGRPLVETIVPPNLRDRHREGLSRYLRTGDARVLGQRVELVGMRKDGSEFPVEVAITQVEGTEPPMFTGFIRDITNRKRNEQERARLLEAERAAREELEGLAAELERRVGERTAELEGSNRELEAFSYSVSHDLRAPLRAIDGFSRIVVRDFGAGMPGQAQEYLGIVREGAQQMGRLIDDLLEFSRLGRHQLARRDVEPRAIVELVLQQLHAETDERDVEVRVLDLPVCWADPSLLRQVYVNLLANALKFTRSRSPAEIEVGCEEQEGRHVYYVRDNGVGFDMQYADKLFGVFQRMHRVEDYEGTGVGLAIVQRVVHRHGGLIWADARPEEGATFSFTLEDRPDE